MQTMTLFKSFMHQPVFSQQLILALICESVSFILLLSATVLLVS